MIALLCTSSSILAAEDPAFGESVNGLAVAVQLDRLTIRPGKRLLAHVLVKNVTDEPIRVLAPRFEPNGFEPGVAELFGWNIKVADRSCRVSAIGKGPFQPDPERSLTIPPKQTALLMSRQLEGTFDLSADGEYTVHYQLSLIRSQLGKGTEADKLWDRIVQSGIWTGTCDSAPSQLTVDPQAPIAGESRSLSSVVRTVNKSNCLIDSNFGDSSLYPGQVVLTEDGNRLRISRLTDSGSWMLEPVPPLKIEAVRVGDKLSVEEEDYSWMLSSNVDGNEKSSSNLKLVLEMDSNKIKVGEPWTGSLRLVNTGMQVVHVSTLGELLTNLQTTQGKPPEIVACMGRGIGPDQAEIEASRKSIEPGESMVLLKLESQSPNGQLGGAIGSNFLSWKIEPGRYELSFKYWMSLEGVAGLEMEPVYTGILHSNIVKMVVLE
jgi:hypothetical protein